MWSGLKCSSFHNLYLTTSSPSSFPFFGVTFTSTVLIDTRGKKPPRLSGFLLLFHVNPLNFFSPVPCPSFGFTSWALSSFFSVFSLSLRLFPGAHFLPLLQLNIIPLPTDCLCCFLPLLFPSYLHLPVVYPFSRLLFPPVQNCTALSSAPDFKSFIQLPCKLWNENLNRTI